MTGKRIFTGALLAMVCATTVLADDRPAIEPAQGTGGGALATVRTIAYLPFKGVVCVVGALASFPAYWLSGLDPQVKSDTEALRARYCSRDYLLGPEWTK
ncbi:MAG: hypothetical protein HYZ72_16910 [Deltaproteobacteria bacterium]|nr:hypothetical protein [Deltaproteobacteria bacterium]